MKKLKCFFHRLTSLAKSGQHEERLSAEIEEHLALQTEENLRAGLSAAEARRRAILQFGGVEAIKESYRDQRGLPFFETLLQDIRHTLRHLRLAPAFTVTTILTLALGIGATTSIFTLAHAVLMKSLPVAKPDELYRLGRESRCCFYGGPFTQNKEFALVSHELYQYLRDHTTGFTELAAFGAGTEFFGTRRQGFSDSAQAYPAEFVSSNYFSMFGIHPWAGRNLTPSDDRPGAPLVAIMSYRLWQQKYASDPSVVGSIFTLNDKPYTVVGITPPGFFGDQLRGMPPDFFLPLQAADPGDLLSPNLYWLDLIGRLRPGMYPGSAEAQMRLELKQWLRSHWSEMSADERAQLPSQTLWLTPGGAGITGMRDRYQHWLQILVMLSGFVLLIACANVAGLLLLRGLERRRHTSLSMALGAGASRVVRQALTESILLALMGGAAGLAVAFAGTRLILYFAFPALPGLAGVPIDAAASMPVLAFAAAASLATGLAFGIVPAWMATRVDPIDALRGAGRSTVRTGSVPRRTLVVLQTAFSLALLAAAGLLTRTLDKLQNQNFGFAQDNRLVIYADPALAGFPPQNLSPLYDRIHDSLAAIPGVSAVALCIYTPLGNNNYGAAIWVDGHPPPVAGEDNEASWNRVTPGYLNAIGDPIVRGRGISDHDTESSVHVAVINEAFARKFFRNEDPIGKHFGQGFTGSARQYEIVGVSRDVRYFANDVDKPVGPFYVLPEVQRDISGGPNFTEISPSSHYLRNIVIVLKPGTAPPIAQIRQAMASVAPDIPVMSIRTMREQVAAQFTQEQLIARLTSFFGILSLILASVGLYGVTAYNAGQRVNEIGVRMAVGSDRGRIVALVLRGAFALILIGLVIGLPLALAAGRFLGSQLYGMSPYDPGVISAAAAVLALSALIASFVPAFRASLISPLEALRAE